MVVSLAGKIKKNEGFDEPDRHQVGAKTVGVVSMMVFGRFVALFVSGAAFVIVARVLGPSVYGIYTLAISYAGFFGTVSDLGVSTATNKFVAEYIAKKDKDGLEKVVSNGYASVVLSGSVLTLIALLLSGFIAVHILGSTSLTYVAELVSFTIIASVLFAFSYNTMVGFGNGRYIAIIILMQSVFQSIASIAFAVMGFGAIAPILGLFIGYAIPIAAVAIILATKFRIKFRKPSLGYIRRFLGFSSPISVYNGLRGFILNLSPIILGLFATTAVVGNFGVALKSSTILTTVTDVLGLAVLPMFAYTVSTKSIGKRLGRFYNYAAYLTYIIMTPALLYVAVLSKQFSYTIFSAKYTLAPTYISIISVGTLLWALAIYTVMLLISTNRVKELLKYGLAVTCIEVVLIFAGVALFNGVGLAIVLYIISPTLVTFFMSRVANRLLGIRLDAVKLLRVFAAGAISAAFLLPILFLLKERYVAILIIGLVEQVLLYPIIVALTGCARRSELDVLRKITASTPIIGKIVNMFADYAGRFVRG